jgi:hypothetical protein
VTSAARSNAVIGASRWLDANKLEGASMNNDIARATTDFSFFMGHVLIEDSGTSPAVG